MLSTGNHKVQPGSHLDTGKCRGQKISLAAGLPIEIEETTFSLARYNRFLADNSDSIDAFKQRQQAAFEAERQHWIATGQADYRAEADTPPAGTGGVELANGEFTVDGHVHGSLWQLAVNEGDTVKEGQQLLVLESMKMEIPVVADRDGIVRRVLCKEGAQVVPGQPLMVIKPLT